MIKILLTLVTVSVTLLVTSLVFIQVGPDKDLKIEFITMINHTEHIIQGKMWLLPEEIRDHSLTQLKSGYYEPEMTLNLIKFMIGKRYKKCADVGSNYGYYTILLSIFCDEIVSIDIQPQMVELVRVNKMNNNIFGSTLNCVFGSSREMEIEIFNIREGFSWQGASTMHEPSCDPIKCRKVLVPSCGADNFDFHKVDVDGFESNFICELKSDMMIELGLNPGWVTYSINKEKSMSCLRNLFLENTFIYLNQPSTNLLSEVQRSYLDHIGGFNIIKNFKLFEEPSLGSLGWNVMNILIIKDFNDNAKVVSSQ